MPEVQVPGAVPYLEAALGDLTRENLDVVVNAANEGLVRGGGVCGAIFAAPTRATYELALAAR